MSTIELQQVPAEPTELPADRTRAHPDPDESTEPSPLSWVSICRVLFYISCWYCISITITLYNKWLFSVYGLHFPLLVTSVHIGLKVPMSRLLMRALGMAPVRFGGWRILLTEVAPSGLAMTGDIALSNLSFLYTTVTYYTIVKSSVPLWILLFSAAYGLLRVRSDLIVVLVFIAGGISLASTDMVGHGGGEDDSTATAALFNTSATLGLADGAVDGAGAPTGAGAGVGAGGDARRRALLAVLMSAVSAHPWRGLVTAAMGSGDGDGTADLPWPPSVNASSGAPPLLPLLPPGPPPEASGESRNDLWGALLVMCAAMCAGFRWACTQVLMAPRHRQDERSLTQESRPLLNPVTLLYYTSPFGLAGLLPIALYREARPLRAYLADSTETPLVVALVLVGAMLGFCLLLAELKVVQLASGLTLSVAGIFKELLTVLASAWLLGDTLTPTNMAGLAICLLGIALYNRSRLLELRRQTPIQIDR